MKMLIVGREIQIPNIAAVGPQFNAALLGSIDLGTTLDFTYGFDLTVCDRFFAFSLPNSHLVLESALTYNRGESTRGR